MTEGLPRAFGDRYTLDGELARGGMGSVYQATDRKLGRAVAIKILNASGHDEESLRRFQQEARTAGSLHHPNILAVYDAGEQDGQPFIVMELLEGQTVRRLLDGGALPPSKALDLGAQLLRGLSAAHDKGIVHRDLKPDNLFLTADGFLKILDFGIVKLLPQTDENHEEFQTPQGGLARAPKTETGRVIGTVGYMPPEQVRGQPVDLRADLFSVGAVLYELLSGKRAFTDGSAVEIAYSILTKEPEPMPGVVPLPARRIVQRCLRKKRDERPASARELLHELEPLLQKTPTASLPRLTSHAIAFFERRRRWFVALGSAALIAVIALIAWTAATRPRAGSDSAPRTIAVMPFNIRGGTQYAYLGEGMVDLLATNLAASGALRAVDPSALVPAAHREGKLDPASARALARRFGAQLYVVGSVVEVEKQLRVQASLFDVDRASAVAEAQAEGHAGQLFSLVDRLTAQLRSALGGSGVPVQGPGGRLGRLAQLTTHSHEALRYYLEGEATLRRGVYRGARDALLRAVEIDPDFALAHYRLAIAAGIKQPGLASDSLHKALRGASRLSVRDRALLEAYAAFFEGRADDAERQYRAITKANPDEVEAFWWLGELLFHYNPLRGRLSAEAEDAFGKVLVLDPQHGGALAHLIDVAQLQGNRQLVAALIDRYLAVASPAAEPGSILPRRWTRAWAVGDQSTRAALLDELSRPGVAREDLSETLQRAVWQGDDLADARVIARIMAEGGEAIERAEGLGSLAILELARGRRRAAKELLARAAHLAPAERHKHDGYWIDTLEFLPVSKFETSVERIEAKTLDAPKANSLPIFRAFIVGALALRAGDAKAALAAADEVEKMPGAGELSVPADLAASLRARVAAKAGRRTEALALLAAMPLRVSYPFNDSLVRLSEQLFRAELLLAEGRAEEALRWASVFQFHGRWEPAYLGPSLLLRARALDKLGRTAEAVDHYRRFATLMSDCDDELKRELEEARRRARFLETALSRPSAIDPRARQ